MLKRASFRDESHSIHSYQAHTLAVKRALGTGPQLVRPAPKKEKAPRKKRERAFYRRLLWIARAFPLAIALTCLFILWDSEQRAASYRLQALESATDGGGAAVGTELANRLHNRIKAPLDPSLAQTVDIGPEHSRRPSRALTPSQGILLRAMARMSARADENASMANALSR